VLEPILQEVARKLESQATIVRVNVAVAEDLAEAYQIEGTPTLLLFLAWQQIGRIEGPPPTASSVMEAVMRPFQR
jgi:thiol-disulfide isomerase/thioredoxin